MLRMSIQAAGRAGLSLKQRVALVIPADSVMDAVIHSSRLTPVTMEPAARKNLSLDLLNEDIGNAAVSVADLLVAAVAEDVAAEDVAAEDAVVVVAPPCCVC